jgi:hypothetical protein
MVYFNKHWVNVWRMDIDMEGHHYPELGCGNVKRSCFHELHLASYCVRHQMADGSWRFCGNRFQVESPRGCSLHHYSGYPENRFFQLAKKNLPYELPTSYPHEEPGWQMVLPKLGNISEPVTICMSMFDGQPAFCRVTEIPRTGQPLMVMEIAKVPSKALQLTEHDDDAEDQAAAADTVPRKPQTFLTLIALEATNEAIFNNQFSYAAFNKLHTEREQKRLVELKHDRKNKQAEVAAESAATKTKKKLPKAKGLKKMLAEKKHAKK